MDQQTRNVIIGLLCALVVNVRGQTSNPTCSCASLRNCLNKSWTLLKLLNGTQLTFNETVYSFLPVNSTNTADTYIGLMAYLSTLTGFNTTLNEYMKTEDYLNYLSLVNPTPSVKDYQVNLRYLIGEIMTSFSLVSKADIVVGNGTSKTLSQIFAETGFVDGRLYAFLQYRYVYCYCRTGRKRRQGGDSPKLCNGKKGGKKCVGKPAPKKSIQKKSAQKKGKKSSRGKSTPVPTAAH